MVKVNKILVSQPRPSSDKSPYFDIEKKYGVEIVFRPFIKVEGLTSKEFRQQKISLPEHTAVIFTAKSAIDHFFRIAEETRFNGPETMKYFCTTEAVAMYLQKHIVYRKRKIFFGDGTADSVIGQIGSRHKGEKFLITTSDSTNNDITRAFENTGMDFTSAVFVKSVSQDLKGVDIASYDMIVLYNKADVKSLYENFPDFKQGDVKFVSYGKSVVKAMEQAGLEIAISAPSIEAPSVAKAVEIYLENNK